MTTYILITAITYADGLTRYYHTLPLTRKNAAIATALRERAYMVICAEVCVN